MYISYILFGALLVILKEIFKKSIWLEVGGGMG